MAKILVIEDDEDMLDSISTYLEFEHYSVEALTSGTEAVQHLRTFSYDAVILDWDLPGMSGPEILRSVRTAGLKTPVLMLTGRSSLGEKEAGLDSGADDYLTKPFEMRELGARIRALLRRTAAAAENVSKARDSTLESEKHRVSSPVSETTSDRHCAQCGLTIPPDLTECPNDEGAILVARAQNLVRTVLAGHFEITALVGIGGMSAVYKAKDRFLDRTVAVKLLHPHLASHPATLRRFEQEAKAISHLTHPNIVGVFEYGISPKGQPFLIMDYLEGLSLAGLLRQEHHLSVARALLLFMSICDALAHAHRSGILHRDIKPSNVMLVDRDGQQDFVKIVDFGLAKLLPGADLEMRQLTQTGEVFGSPLYMSPEQVMGRTLDARSDIFSLGCVMYEVLSGTPPFVGENIMETMYKRTTEDAPPFEPELNISNNLETLVLMALSRDPDRRYQSMLDLRQDLDLVKQGAVPSPRRTQAFRKAPRPRLKPAYVQAAMALAAVALAMLGFFAWTMVTSWPR